jgi:hypothetical protein
MYKSSERHRGPAARGAGLTLITLSGIVFAFGRDPHPYVVQPPLASELTLEPNGWLARPGQI